jgi:hypothetical protein
VHNRNRWSGPNQSGPLQFWSFFPVAWTRLSNTIGTSSSQGDGGGFFSDNTNDVPPLSRPSRSIIFLKQSTSSLFLYFFSYIPEDNGSIDYPDSGFSYQPVSSDSHFSILTTLRQLLDVNFNI